MDKMPNTTGPLGAHGPTALAVDSHVHNPGLHGRFVALDLDENDLHRIEARGDGDSGAEPSPLGWGVCRHGFGLQNLPRGLSKEHAEVIACLENRRAVAGAGHHVS